MRMRVFRVIITLSPIVCCEATTAAKLRGSTMPAASNISDSERLLGAKHAYTKMGTSDYTIFDGVNVYPPDHGAAVGDDKDAYKEVNFQGDCMGYCDRSSWCQCVTYQMSTKKCWRRAGCVPLKGKKEADFQVFMKKRTSSPTEMPTEMPTWMPTEPFHPHPHPHPSKMPNIVIVMADDLGKPNIGFTAKLGVQKTGQASFESQPSFTPKTTALAKEGIILDRHYSYLSCTPSRASLLSGRLPAHIGTELGEPDLWDGGTDKMWGYEGLSPNMSLLPRYLKNQGYSTHALGKADGFGIATQEHIPTGRGFDSFLGYYSHGNDYWNYRNDVMTDPKNGFPNPQIGGAGAAPQCQRLSENGQPPYVYNDPNVIDMMDGDGPAWKAKMWRSERRYEEGVFLDRALSIIADHDVSKPFFMFYASHLTHSSLQVPDSYYDRIAAEMCAYNPGCLNDKGECSLANQSASILPLFTVGPGRKSTGECALVERVILLSMVAYLDDVVGELTDALKNKGMWDNTFFLFVGDNGGGLGVQIGGSNWPYKGGKGGDWEGGYMTPTFIAGGVIPHSARGSVRTQTIHISDWMPTILNLAKVPPKDVHETAAHEKAIGLPGIDGVDVYSTLVHNTGEPHDVVHLGPRALLVREADGHWYKILVGVIANTIWVGPDYPNSTCPGLGINPLTNENLSISVVWTPERCRRWVDRSGGEFEVNVEGICRPWNPAPFGPPSLPTKCGTTSDTGCLYDITADPYEKENLAKAQKERFRRMYTKFVEVSRDNFEPHRGCNSYGEFLQYCKAAIDFYQGNYGPFLNVPECGDKCTHTTEEYFRKCAAGEDPDCVKATANDCQCYTTKDDCTGDDECEWSESDMFCDLKPERPEPSICRPTNNLGTLV